LTTYYVNSDVAGPGDGSFGDPWDDINTNLSSLSAGDTMLLRGGNTKAGAQSYTEQVNIRSSNSCANGTAVNPITIRNYTDEYVVFDVNGADPDQMVIDRSYWIIEGQGVDGNGDYYMEFDKQARWQSAVQILAGGDYTELRYLEVHNGSYFGIDIDDSDYVIIENCTVYDFDGGASADAHGIIVRGFSDYGTIRNCEIYDCFGDCIEVFTDFTTEEKTSWEVHDCEMYTNVAAQGSTELAIGFKGGESWSVHDNTVHGFRHCDGTTGGTSSDGEAFIIGAGGINSEFYDNIIYDISGNAIRIDRTGVVFRHNLIYDLAYDSTTDEATVLYVTSGGDNAKLYNNTVVGDYGWPTQADDKLYRSLAGATGVILKNNIFKDTGDINDGGSQTYDYNCWYNAYATLSGANDVTDDPLFNDEGADDYTLASNSPCIDAGVDLGYSYNGSAPDIGYWESDYPAATTTIAGYAVLKETASVTVGGMAYLQGVTAGGVLVLDGARVVVDGARVVVG
jgi:hypothetical protein